MGKRLLWILLFIFDISYNAVLAGDGHCIWYGQCGRDSVSGKPLNCQYNGTAKALTDPTGLQLLKEYCPSMYDKTDPTSVQTCCDGQQIHTLVSNLQIPKQILARCPSCYKNFNNLFCHMTCDPEQSKFLVDSRRAIFDKNGTYSVSAIKYAVSSEFAYGMFNSCKDVEMPSSGQKALGLLCGRSAENCTAEKWLQYMGDQDLNPLVPFPIDFNITHSDIIVRRYDGKTVSLSPMNETIQLCKDVCSCTDCGDSCEPPSPPIIPRPPCEIMRMNCLTFSMVCLYAAFVIFFAAFLVMERCSAFHHCPQIPCISLHKAGAKFKASLEHCFEILGKFCARFPGTIVVVNIVIFIATILSAEICGFKVENSLGLFLPKHSEATTTNKKYFEESFMPMQRTEQLIIRAKNSSQWWKNDLGQSTGRTLWGPVFRMDILREVLQLQNFISTLTVYDKDLNRNISFHDICFQPHYSGNACAISSVLQYYQNDYGSLMNKTYGPGSYRFYVTADYSSHFSACARNPTAVDDTTPLHASCLATYGTPVLPWLVLGGFPGNNYENATALLITLTVSNFKNETFQKMVNAWEWAFTDYLLNYSRKNDSLIVINYKAESSLEDVLEAEVDATNVIGTVIWKTNLVFAVIGICMTVVLWQYHALKTIICVPQIFFGLAAIGTIANCLYTSVTICNLVGLKFSFLTLEVLPIIVLVLGIDNFFLLIHAFQTPKYNKDWSVDEEIAIALQTAGPSMLLTSVTQFVVFLSGWLFLEMPVVKTLCLYSALGVAYLFILQIVFFPCVLQTCENKYHKLVSEFANQSRKGSINLIDVLDTLKRLYAKFLLHPCVRPLVMLTFVGCACTAVAMTSRLHTGFSLRTLVPKDTYLSDFYNVEAEYAAVGPPVYFVVETGYDYSTLRGQNQLCGGTKCNQNSLVEKLGAAAYWRNSTHIYNNPTSWLDAYFDWITASCKEYHNHTQCEPKDINTSVCQSCQVNHEGRPVGSSFSHYLPWFLKANMSHICSYGDLSGCASTSVQLLYNNNSEGEYTITDPKVGATYFKTHHTNLITTRDHIEAISYATELAANITSTLQHEDENLTDSQTGTVFAYSTIFDFYEQFLSMVTDMWKGIILSICAVFGLCFLLFWLDVWSSVIIVVVESMIVSNVLGLMALCDITLNPFTVVNIFVSIGMAIGLCTRMVRAFAQSDQASRLKRAADAPCKMDIMVQVGITITKLFSISILAFSQFHVVRIYYFLPYSFTILTAAAHELVFLPVMLSYFGKTVSQADHLQIHVIRMP